MDMRANMLRQLAVDFNTTPDSLCGGCNVYVLKTRDPRKRAYEDGAAVLNVLCINGICVFCASDGALLDELRTAYSGFGGEWFLELDNLHRLDALLKPVGQSTASCHQYYIPRRTTAENEVRAANILPPSGLDFTWYDADGLAQFQGDARFNEALGGNPAWPDQLGVAALECGRVVGMAAASRDSELLWQIGVNVDACVRGRGIATMLVTLLRDELIRRGITPFYGTAASHIISQRVAVAAGFEPAWAELYTKAIDDR